ncbi:MAG: Ig-like domain-containing protein [Candidatus Thermoplasmatota archaeon]|nr:Ig-like domain-containing protein [Candidatus Thermoplasmatota archaeon]
MKANKVSFALAAVLLIFSSVPVSQGIPAISSAGRMAIAPNSAAFTHSVLGELFAFSSDQASAAAEAAMAGLGATYGHDFHFVTILTDVYNANGRDSYYNILTPPTIEFDGGFMEDTGGTLTGAGQGATLVETCAQRPVQVVKMAVFLDAQNITVKMMYEGLPQTPVPSPTPIPALLPFRGHLRAYVCEKNSSIKNAEGIPVPNAAVAVAFDEDVSLDQGKWVEMATLHHYGDNLSNIIVAAGLFEIYGGVAEVPKLSTCVQSACSDETSGENSPPEISNIYTSPKYPTGTDSVTVYATVTDDKSLMTVELAYCQNEVCKSPAPMTNEGGGVYSFSLGVFTDGTKVKFNIRAEDGQGAEYRTPEYYFIVGSDDLPPVCEIKIPKNGEKVSGQLVILGVASDDKGIQKVEVKIDDFGWQTAQGNENWSYSPDMSKIGGGSHKIKARSYDGSLYSEEYSIGIKTAGGDSDGSSGELDGNGGVSPIIESGAMLGVTAGAIIVSAVLLVRRRI